MVNTRTDAELAAAVQAAVDAMLPQIREQVREEYRTGASGSNPPPVTIHTWLERFNKQKPRSFEKAVAPVDAENWISHMEKIFDVMDCNDAFKTRLAVYKFEGDALAWWKAYKQAKGGDAWVLTLTWAAFKELFFLQFFPRAEQERLKREYHSIRQRASENSTEYMQRFLRLAGFLGQAAGTAEEQAKNFRWGLHKSILDHVMCIQFTDVAQVADVARNLEILRDRDDYDRSERSDKRHKSGDRYHPYSQQGSHRSHGILVLDTDQRKRGPAIHRYTKTRWFPSSPGCQIVSGAVFARTQEQAANTSGKNYEVHFALKAVTSRLCMAVKRTYSTEEELPDTSYSRSSVTRLLERGFIRPDVSPWGAPVLFVMKKERAINIFQDLILTWLPSVASERARDISRMLFRTLSGHYEFLGQVRHRVLDDYYFWSSLSHNEEQEEHLACSQFLPSGEIYLPCFPSGILVERQLPLWRVVDIFSDHKCLSISSRSEELNNEIEALVGVVKDYDYKIILSGFWASPRVEPNLISKIKQLRRLSEKSGQLLCILIAEPSFSVDDDGILWQGSDEDVLTFSSKHLWWSGMKRDVSYVCVKVFNMSELEDWNTKCMWSLLTPLEIPVWKWEKCSMDFVTGYHGLREERCYLGCCRSLDLNRHIFLISVKDYTFKGKLGEQAQVLVTAFHTVTNVGQSEVEKLKEAQTRQKSYADRHRRALEFQPGEHVFLKVSPTRGVRRFGIKGKLSPRFIGSFESLDRVGEVSYRLAFLPQLSQVHNVFMISLLKMFQVFFPLFTLSLIHSIRSVEDLSEWKEPEFSILERQAGGHEEHRRSLLSNFLWWNHPEAGSHFGETESI
ncbi:zinc finger, CCHC-type, retrotransposon gag domain protein [Tanacetum coccineum]